MPIATVIVPFFNTGNFLNEAIESVLRQSFVDWELILVDDQSNDNSAKIAIDYSIKYPNKIFYVKPNKLKNQGPSFPKIRD
jgi:glycosyltransferase involved in cell wall biosynthesis